MLWLVLGPAAMELLERSNLGVPGPLERVLPARGLEEAVAGAALHAQVRRAVDVEDGAGRERRRTEATFRPRTSRARCATTGSPSEDLLVTGDDVRMDIGLGLLGGSRTVLGLLGGSRTVLVRSGITGDMDVSRLPERRRPHAVIEGVQELLAWL